METAAKLMQRSGMSSDQIRDRARAAIIGSIVADAATQPVNWVSDTDRLNQGLRNQQEPEFNSEWMNPYYRTENGTFSVYADQCFVLLRSLVENKGFHAKKYMEAIYENFGPGSYYDQQEAKYHGTRQGPWRSEHMSRAFAKMKSGDTKSGVDVAECDAYTMVTPLVAMYAGSGHLDKYIDQAVRITLNNDRAVRTAQFYGKLLEHYILHGRDPEGFRKVLDKFPDHHNKCDWQRVYDERVMSNMEAVQKYGYGSSLPGNFQTALNCIAKNQDYVSAVRTNMRSGGSSCARACAVGACSAAQYGPQSIPSNWISRTRHGNEIVNYANELSKMMKK